MKRKMLLGGTIAAAMVLSGCGTAVRSMPIPADAIQSDSSNVKVYFGSQPHPAIKTNFGPRSASSRVARESDEQLTCEHALGNALERLRAYAKDHGANALVNVNTRFHEHRSDSQTAYTCGVSPSAGAVVVSGDVVLLEAQ
jgi:hypothetical protein